MNDRQQREDDITANAVVRGLNILEVRNPGVARHYMEYNAVPAAVIARVLDHPMLRRKPSAGQLLSEAITPAPPDEQE
jgi:hypothetical protein